MDEAPPGRITPHPSNTLHDAVEIGQLLLQAKSQCRHGEWGPWLDRHFDGSRRTANIYMRLARVFQGTLLERHARASVREAVAMLTGQRLLTDAPRLDTLTPNQGAPVL